MALWCEAGQISLFFFFFSFFPLGSQGLGRMAWSKGIMTKTYRRGMDETSPTLAAEVALSAFSIQMSRIYSIVRIYHTVRYFPGIFLW